MTVNKNTVIGSNDRYRKLICILLFVSLHARGQDQTNFTQFFLNPYLYNASYAGIDGQAALSLIYKKQWMTIAGAPSVANLSLQTPIGGRTSFGLNVTNDTRGSLTNSSALFTFGYNAALGDHSFLRFGISGGGAWNTVDVAKLESLSADPAFGNVLDNHASIAGNAGISLHLNTFQLGASMPAVFSPSYVSREDFSITEVAPFESLIFNASNRFYFSNDKNIFEPYFIYRMNTGLPSQFEVAGVFHFNHIVWIGGSYKQDFGISGLGGIKLNNLFALGASYSLQNSGVNELNSPSFEISLSLLFGKRKKNAPLYSFVNTEKPKADKKSATELAAEKRKADEAARKKQQEVLAQQKKEEEQAKKEAEALRLQQELAQEDTQQEQPVAAPADVPLREASIATNPPTIVPERHERVRRGTHASELNSGEYIIVGAFKSEPNARRYGRGLIQLGHNANYGRLTEKDLWYVYIHRSDDINQAREVRDKYRTSVMFKDAWLLTVHE